MHYKLKGWVPNKFNLSSSPFRKPEKYLGEKLFALSVSFLFFISNRITKPETLAMSSRALRRLQEGSGVQGLPCSEPLSQNQDESEEPPATTVPFAGARAKFSTPHLNPFDLVFFWTLINNLFICDFWQSSLFLI